MARVEDVTPGASLRGVLPNRLITAISLDLFRLNCLQARLERCLAEEHQLTALNEPEWFIAAMVQVGGDLARVWYVRRPFDRAPRCGEGSANFDLGKLLAAAEVVA